MWVVVFWLPATWIGAEGLRCELVEMSGVRPALDNETLTLLHSFCFHHHH